MTNETKNETGLDDRFAIAGREFPDWTPPEDLPALPGWSDDSWHNNVCPSMRRETGIEDLVLYLWIDYADPSARELTETPRYVLHLHDEAQGEAETIASGETWSEFLKAAKASRAKKFFEDLEG